MDIFVFFTWPVSAHRIRGIVSLNGAAELKVLAKVRLGICPGGLTTGSRQITGYTQVHRASPQPKVETARGPSAGWIHRTGYIHATGNYLVFKRQEILIHATVRMDLEGVVLSQISQS